jgi:hypothetical protein
MNKNSRKKFKPENKYNLLTVINITTIKSNDSKTLNYRNA